MLPPAPRSIRCSRLVANLVDEFKDRWLISRANKDAA
jgi:hypothetical protein